MARRRSKPEHMAIDEDGKPMAYAPDEVRGKVLEMLKAADAELLAVVIRQRGDLAVQVFGPPTQELLGVLVTAARAYRRMLKGH